MKIRERVKSLKEKVENAKLAATEKAEWMLTSRDAKSKVFFARAVIMAGASALSSVSPVYATEAAGTAAEAMGNLISIVAAIFRYVGIALFAWGAIQFILATKRSDADSKSDAIQTAMCGIALMLIIVVLNKLGLGVTIENVEL